MANRGSEVRNQGVAELYVVRCPDVLEVYVAGRNEAGGGRAVGLDGQVDLGPLGRLRVEGLTVPEVAYAVAGRAGTTPDQVRVRVAEYNSQRIYLHGEGNGVQRTVPYLGPETVLDLLQRVGGVTPGAAPGNVHVIRPHVAEGRQPEIYAVDLNAVVRKHDARTNLRLQPFDQVYVGETRKSSLQKCVPPWLRPLYEAACGLYRPAADKLRHLDIMRKRRQDPEERPGRQDGG
jgi:protein involved in polysaccharide export with SLBB domain